MRHVDYTRWARYLSRVFNKAVIPVRNVLDISCGTAKLSMELMKLGYRMAASDNSFAMLQQARQNLRACNTVLPLWQASMSRYSLRRKYDAVVSTYDSFNYCLSGYDRDGFFESAMSVLIPGGLLVFDICTLRNSKRYFLDYHERESLQGISYERRSYFQAEKRLQYNEFLISERGQGTVYQEIHKQKIYTIREIRDMISHWPFEILGIYEGFTFRTGSEKSDRIHFVLLRN
jgi:SAM-dependent methyltransferase